MAVNSLASYKEALKSVHSIYTYKAMPNARSNLSSGWSVATSPSASIPSTAVALDNTTVGALNYEDILGNTGHDFRLASASANIALGSGVVTLIDRLCEQGGLSATDTSTQTTNLPTAALTRYTNGVGVMAGVEIYTAVGTTATTVTGSYTNSSGTSGRTFKPIIIGATTYNGAGRILVFPLEDGDQGVRSVESITLTGSTGTVGNIGVTLFKPLAMNHITVSGVEGYGTNTYNALIGGGFQFEPILAGACLSMLHLGSAGGSYGVTFNFMDVS